MEPTTVLSLPPELRTAIYSFLLPTTAADACYNLRLTCHQIRAELDDEIIRCIERYHRTLETALTTPVITPTYLIDAHGHGKVHVEEISVDARVPCPGTSTDTELMRGMRETRKQRKRSSKKEIRNEKKPQPPPPTFPTTQTFHILLSTPLTHSSLRHMLTHLIPHIRTCIIYQLPPVRSSIHVTLLLLLEKHLLHSKRTRAGVSRFVIYRQRDVLEEQDPPPAPGLVFWDALGDVVLRREAGEVLLRNSDGRVEMGLCSGRSASEAESEIWRLVMVWGVVGLVIGWSVVGRLVWGRRVVSGGLTVVGGFDGVDYMVG
jgi:hypothetical protein